MKLQYKEFNNTSWILRIKYDDGDFRVSVPLDTDLNVGDDIIFTSQFPRIQSTHGTSNSSIYLFILMKCSAICNL